MILKQPSDGRIFESYSQIGAGKTDLAEPRAKDALAHDERRPASRAALLAIIVREHDSFARDAINVRRSIANHAKRITADVRLADIVSPDDENIGFLLGKRLSCKEQDCQRRKASK